MKIKGKYEITIMIQNMFINHEIVIKRNNLITLLGESFFMNRWINEEFKPLQYICLGTGTKRPDKQDITLGNETVRKKADIKVNLSEKTLNLKVTFSAREINNTTEIGVSNGDILVSHDLYAKITTPLTSTITLNYMFILTTGGIRSKWSQLTSNSNTYFVKEPNTVIGVIENNTNSGYIRKNNKNDIETSPGSYYYDLNKRIVYIHTTNSANPNLHKIILKME